MSARSTSTLPPDLVKSTHRPSLAKQGFTLVEVIIVVVILSLFAGMMTLSVGGGESRKNKAFYEHLQGNINYVKLLAVEQMQPYGLAIKLAQNNEPSQVLVVKLARSSTQSPLTNTQNTAPSWQLDKQVEPLIIPENVDINISPLDTLSSTPQNAPNWLAGDQAPPVVWFGTGEATPVQISVKTKNGDGDTYLVGDPIIINAVGAIEPSGNTESKDSSSASSLQNTTGASQ